MGAIYVALGEERGELCHPDRQEDFELFASRVDGTPRAASWEAIRVHLVRQEHDGTPFRETDAPWLGSHALVFRARAVAAMRSLLEPRGEFLPLADVEGSPLWVFNP